MGKINKTGQASCKVLDGDLPFYVELSGKTSDNLRHSVEP